MTFGLVLKTFGVHVNSIIYKKPFTKIEKFLTRVSTHVCACVFVVCLCVCMCVCVFVCVLAMLFCFVKKCQQMDTTLLWVTLLDSRIAHLERTLFLNLVLPLVYTLLITLDSESWLNPWR